MEYTIDILLQRVEAYKKFSNTSKLNSKIRRPNFPEDISQNIVKFSIGCDDITPGDLYSDSLGKIEVKCFSSFGPISFGPNEVWNTLVILDATFFEEDRYVMYIVNVNSKNFNPSVSTKQSFKDQCRQRRRPRLTSKKIIEKYQLECKIFNIDLANISTTGTVTALPAIL